MGPDRVRPLGALPIMPEFDIKCKLIDMWAQEFPRGCARVSKRRRVTCRVVPNNLLDYRNSYEPPAAAEGPLP